MTELSYSAQQVHEEYLRNAKSPTWRMAFEIALGEWMRDIATYHQGPIQAIADRAMLRSLNSKQDDIAKRFLLDRLSEIRKDDEWDPSKHKRGGNPKNRGQFSHQGSAGSTSAAGTRTMPGAFDRGEHWGTSGRHIGEQMGANLGQVSDRRRNAQAVMEDQRRRMMETGRIPEVGTRTQAGRQNAVGLLSRPVTLPADTSPGDHKADVLRREAAMTYALAEKTRNAADKQRVQYTITGPRGSRVVVPPVGEIPNDINWEGGERVRYMAPVGPDNPASVAGKLMDIGLVAGMDEDRAARSGSVVADIHDTFNTTDWGQRLNNVANVARVVSNNSPIASQAMAVAGLVNILGPDAARAFKPRMLQLSYRYTGQEAAPMQMSDVARNGKQEGETTEGYESRLAIDLARSLPTKTEYAAALQAGSTPPSKGYLLDKNGKVVSEAVGFADDWYTPFNLRRLPKLKDGSYVRTRGYGGVTPEDIQLALHTGAQRVTVVSNSGVFSLELDDRAKQFGHRYGFGGAAMQRRYAKSLDAIHNNKVSNPDQPGRSVSLNTFGYQTAMADLKNKYPYFVKNVTVRGPINNIARRGDEGVIGSASPDEPDRGYVRPLRIKASGAQYGYADPGVANDRSGGKVAYDQLEHYRLRRGQGGLTDRGPGQAPQTQAQTGGRPATQSYGGGRTFVAGPNGSVSQVGQSRSDPPVAGGRLQESSYDNARERIDAKEATRMMDDFRTIFDKNPDQLGELSEELEAVYNGATAEKNSPEWQRVRNRLMEKAEVRESILGQMSDKFGATKEGQSLLPSMEVLAAADDTEDEDEGEDSEYYGDNSIIAPSTLSRSGKFQAWKKQLGNKDDAESRGLLKDVELFERVMAEDSKAGEWDTYQGLQPGEKEQFDYIHRVVNGMLNDEVDIAKEKEAGRHVEEDTQATQRRDQQEQAERAPDDLQVSRGFSARAALEAPDHLRYAMELVNEVVDSDPDQRRARRRIQAMHDAAQQQGNAAQTEAQKEKLLDVADAFDTALKFMDEM